MESNKNHNQLKAASAGIGVTAAVAMGTLGALDSGESAGVQMRSEPSMTTGETVTRSEDVPGGAPKTSIATPSVTFTTPEGFAEPH